jgi:hypothetical protein
MLHMLAFSVREEARVQRRHALRRFMEVIEVDK